MKREMNLPKKCQYLSNEEMNIVTGGSKKDGIDEMSNFLKKILKRRK